MTRIARLVGLAAGLLLFFFLTMLASQHWLRQQAEDIRIAALHAREAQLEKILALSQPGPPPWSDEFLHTLGAALGATISRRTSKLVDNHADAFTKWEFDYTLRNDTGKAEESLRVQVPLPPTVRLTGIYQQLSAALLMLAFALLLGLGMAIFLSARRLSPSGPDAAGSNQLNERQSLARLAEVSVQQGADLQRERSERERAEEDLHFKQVLLNRALEEKIGLGRDLHDGTIQALYATGLTLEAVKNTFETNPTQTRQQLEACMQALNSTIKDVRGYIIGLSPESLRRQSFTESIRTLTRTLDAGRSIDFEVRIDDEATGKLNEAQASELLQIVREAISNSLRHGRASKITLRMHEDNEELCLLISDNGAGFDQNRKSKNGHGLGNMQARANRLNGLIHLTSELGKGTRLVLTMPINISSTQ